jgi:UDP-N-acetylmuramyl pentapeptide phosphotransferase/UDP-N-acetylglucosamine-1-phosphate transferase
MTIFLMGIASPTGPGPWILIGMLTIGLVSFADDVRSLSASFRFICQSVAAGIVIAALHWSFSKNPDGGYFPLALYVLAEFFWLVGYTNAFNFMDGINGLAAGQAVVTGLGSFLLIGLGTQNWATPQGFICLTIAGASAGFLPHNAVRPRLFMGDVGSASLGFILAGVTLWIARDVQILLLSLLLLHVNFVLDTSITMLRRFFNGDPWREPHREHFYQRVVRSGSPHTAVTTVEISLQLVVLGLALLCLQATLITRLVLASAVVALWFGFFAWAERRFLRARQSATPRSEKAASQFEGQ